jgi:hypothetical protein
MAGCIVSFMFRKAAGKGLIAKTIALTTGGPYDHCECQFPDGRSFSSSAMDGGTRWKDIIYNPATWDEVQIIVSPEELEKMLKTAQALEGRPYGWGGVVAFAVRVFKNGPLVVPEDGSVFCSETCLLLCVAAGKLKTLPAKALAPVHLYYALKAWREAWDAA